MISINAYSNKYEKIYRHAHRKETTQGLATILASLRLLLTGHKKASKAPTLRLRPHAALLQVLPVLTALPLRSTAAQEARKH